MKRIIFYIIFYALLSSSLELHTQTLTNHWETVIYSSDLWKYKEGYSEPSSQWKNLDFDESTWKEDQGGFGYGDGDDKTRLNPVRSVYLRKVFNIIDLSNISSFLFHADYDDGFVAYINGIEVARSNIGKAGESTPFDELASDNHEAQIYQGGVPELFSLDYELLKTILKNGDNVLGIQVHNQSATSSDLSSIFYLSFGIKDERKDYRPIHEYFDIPFTSSNLPIIIINTDNNATIINNIKIDGDLGLISNKNNIRNSIYDPFNEYDGRIGIEIRGSSSTMFPKKNYSLETRDFQGENNNVELLGMPKENDWVLHGPYSDKSLMRNALSYHIGELIGQYTPRTRFCELVINDNYQGVYLLTEKIKRDKNRVNIAKLKPEDVEGDEITGGYLFQIDRDDPGVDDGWYSNHSKSVFYHFSDPKHNELIDVQKKYIKDYMNGFEDMIKQLGAHEAFDQYIDLESFVDYWIATEIFKHIDGWKLSFYMYKKKDSNGGKLHLGPIWDLNLAYGNSNFGNEVNPEGWSYVWAKTSNIRPFWVPQITEIPIVSNEINCRWQKLRTSKLHSDSLFQYLLGKRELLTEATDRNFKRWPIIGKYVWPNDFVGTTYEEEFDFLTNWLDQRLKWMDANMIGNCTTNTYDISQNSNSITVYPNPIIDGELKINLPLTNHKNINIKIYNPYGNLVLNKKLFNHRKNNINVKLLPNGLYYFQLLENQELLKSGRFIHLSKL